MLPSKLAKIYKGFVTCWKYNYKAGTYYHICWACDKSFWCMLKYLLAKIGIKLYKVCIKFYTNI